MITVSNVDGQLQVIYPNKTEYYQFPKFSNLCWILNNDGNYYIQLTYEADYFVKIKLLDISNQPTWTNDLAGAEQAVIDIAKWIGDSFLILSGIGSALSSIAITPNIIRATGSGAINVDIYSFSVSNVGGSNGTILGQTIKPGETLSFDGGTLNNYYSSGVVTYNGTGTELLIIYNS